MAACVLVVGGLWVSSGFAGGAVGPRVRLVAVPVVAATPLSGSMEPTIHCANGADPDCEASEADLLLEEESGVRDVRRGEIVAFREPAAAGRVCAPSGGKEWLKRVIGLGGDRLVMRGGLVWLNGRRLAEPYVPASERGSFSGRWRVPKGSFFVMGDNRRISCDSRFFGPVEASLVTGRVIAIIRHGPGSNSVGPPILHKRYPWVGDDNPWAGMEPTIRCARPQNGCTAARSDVVLTELSGSRSVGRGAIVLFRVPKTAPSVCGRGFVYERVIGIPGEQVSEHDGTVAVDGKPLAEPYVPASERDHRSGSWQVPQGAYFVMADNRAHACDSRYWGPVPATSIRGRVTEIIRTRSPA